MTAGATILIVDDDDDIRESVADALDDAGYRVASAANGIEALTLLREQHLRPDAILLDVMMPGMDGMAFRAEQRSDLELAHIPVILFSAYGSAKNVAQELGVAAFVKKPLRLDDLLDVIRRVQGSQGRAGVPS
jgi:CheY-like chemotaxis protein